MSFVAYDLHLTLSITLCSVALYYQGILFTADDPSMLFILLIQAQSQQSTGGP
jgi:hypothetical protein